MLAYDESVTISLALKSASDMTEIYNIEAIEGSNGFKLFVFFTRYTIHSKNLDRILTKAPSRFFRNKKHHVDIKLDSYIYVSVRRSRPYMLAPSAEGAEKSGSKRHLASALLLVRYSFVRGVARPGDRRTYRRSKIVKFKLVLVSSG